MSRPKREHRKTGLVTQQVRGVSAESLVPLIEAASVSPGTFHRLPSLLKIFVSVTTRSGSQPADAGLLDRLLDVARQENSDLERGENMWSVGDMLEASVRWGDDLYRVPRCLFRHQRNIVGVLRLAAKATDPTLLDRLGFGLSDAIELALRRIDHVVGVLAPASPGPTQPPGPALLTDAEVSAAESLLDISHQVTSCRFPERAQRALDYLTVHPKQMIRYPMLGAGGGHAIAVKGPCGSQVAVPARILADSILLIGQELGERAAQFDPTANQRWEDIVTWHIANVLTGSYHPLTGPLRENTGKILAHSVIAYTPDRVVLLDVVSGLQGASLNRKMQASTKRMDDLTRRRFALMVNGEQATAISPDAEMVGLQVVAYPGIHPPLIRGRYDNTTLHGFASLVRSVSPDAEDLWWLLRETEQMFLRTGWPVADLYEAWLAWKGNDRQLPPPDTQKHPDSPARALVWQDARSTDMDWALLHEGTDIERALIAAGLPPLFDWPHIQVGLNRTILADDNQGRLYHVIPCDPPVLLSMLNVETLHEDDDSAEDIYCFFNGLADKFVGMKENLPAFIRREGMPALLVRVDHRPDAASLVTIGRENGTTVTVNCGVGVVGMLADALEELLGAHLVEAFGSDFLAIWKAAPSVDWNASRPATSEAVTTGSHPGSADEGPY